MSEIFSSIPIDCHVVFLYCVPCNIYYSILDNFLGDSIEKLVRFALSLLSNEIIVMPNITNNIGPVGSKRTGSLDGSLVPSEQGNQDDLSFESIFQRLKDAFGATTETDLARTLGIKPESVYVAKKRKQLPSRWIVDAFMRHNISSDWLLSGAGPMRRGEEISKSQTPSGCLAAEDYEPIPLLASWVTGGPQGELLYEGIADYYPFKRWWIENLVGRGNDRKRSLLLVRVRGDSMIPTIGPGEVILVDTFEGERLEIRTGQIYLVRQPDSTVAVKRLALSERGDRFRLICMSDNPVQKAFDFELDPGHRIQDYVLGRVRWAGKEFD